VLRTVFRWGRGHQREETKIESQPSQLTANAKGATVLVSIPASSDTVESEGAAGEAVVNKLLLKNQKNYPKKQIIFIKGHRCVCVHSIEKEKIARGLISLPVILIK
jgi:hypothetical protein